MTRKKINKKKMLAFIVSLCAPVSFITFFLLRKIKIVSQHITGNKTVAPVQIRPAVIFDLNDVLFTIDRKKALKHLGFFDSMVYTVTGGSPEKLEEKMFDILSSIDSDQFSQTASEDLVPLHKNKPLPAAACDWMAGLLSTEDIIDQALQKIEQLDTQNYFKNKREKRFISKAIKLFLDPQIRSDLYKPINSGISLVKTCKKLGHQVYLLSNMDANMIPLLEKKYPDIFDIFDGKIISADVQMIKPHKNIYQYTLNQYNLQADNCYFIDDQPENITGAQSIGINGILCNHKKYDQVYSELHQHGILPARKVIRQKYRQRVRRA